MGLLFKGLVGYVVGGYVYDVVWRPSKVAYDARQYAHSRNKPLLNVGAGTEHSSLRAALLGPTLWGDVNVDIAAAAELACTPNQVCFADGTETSNSALPSPHT